METFTHICCALREIDYPICSISYLRLYSLHLRNIIYVKFRNIFNNFISIFSDFWCLNKKGRFVVKKKYLKFKIKLKDEGQN